MAEWICVLAVLLLAVLFVIRPGRPNPVQEAKFRGRNFAHRGLHTKDRSVPENSLAAFAAAADAGYGIELDVQFSKEGKVVVFHDDTLDRVTGVHGRVDSFSLEELKAMRLCGTDETIPLFEEVLKLVNGRVPLIVELKTGPRNRELCEKTWAYLKEYSGDYCIESFDPRIVSWFRKNAPGVLRGQLASGYREYNGHKMAFPASRLLGNVIARPQFIAWGPAKKNGMVKLCEAFGPLKIRWTARDPRQAPALEEEFDAVIFEHYTPHTHFEK